MVCAVATKEVVSRRRHTAVVVSWARADRSKAAGVTTDSTITSDVVRLVLGVARLGENDLRGWWSGHALDRTGRYVLSNMFRRTWRSAALELDVAAATVMHNQLLGRSTALHLFSDLLPFRRWTTGWLAEQKTAVQLEPLVLELEEWTPDPAIASLRAWCGATDSSRGEELGDGLRLGQLSPPDIADAGALRNVAAALAASYLDQAGPLRPPYFDLVR